MVQYTPGVFVSAETDALFHFHFERSRILNPLVVYNDLDKFRQSRHDRKVACLQMPYPVRPEFDQLIDNLVECSDAVLVLMSELHDRTIDIVRRHDNPKVSYFICGDFNFDLEYSPVHKFYDWFTTTVHFYKYVRPATLDELTPDTPKPYYFDALLGRKKLHRDIAYSQLNQTKNVVRYIGDINCNFEDPDKWIWEDQGLERNKKVEWTVERLPYYGHSMSVSQIIPITVYNQTAYTLIAETNHSNHYSFYTEKTVKPILGGRLFLCLSGQGALKNLRKLGFKTFNGIIDESYDDVSNLEERCGLVMRQVEFLETQPQADILEQVKPIVEHNRNLMLSTAWYDQYFRPAFASYF
jgi:hypothetical protein